MRRNWCAVCRVWRGVRYLLVSTLLAAALIVSGCAVSPAPTPTPVATSVSRAISGATFTQFGGCGDVFMWAATADDTMAVTVEWAEAASQAWDNDGFEETASLPQPDVRLLLVVGHRLSETYCTDFLTDGPRVDGEAPAVAGTVDLSVRPDAGGFKPASRADLTLRDVGFEVIFGTETQKWVVDQLELRDIAVGWLAG